MLVLSAHRASRPCSNDADGVPRIGNVDMLAVIEVTRFRRPQSTPQQEQNFSQSGHCTSSSSGCNQPGM
jgi:hypothetical protein